MGHWKPTSLALATLLATTTIVQADDWRGTITPYIWLPSFSSNFTIGTNPPTDGTVDWGDKLQGAFMITGDYRNDDYAIIGDYIYLDLGGQLFKNLPPLATDTSLSGYTFMMSGAKTLSRSENSQIEAYVGLRHWRVDAGAANNLLGEFGASASWTDPIIGLQGHRKINERITLLASADVGGFGLGSELQVDAKAQANWAFNDWSEIGIGYRYLKVDFEDTDRVLLDMTIQGPFAALEFKF